MSRQKANLKLIIFLFSQMTLSDVAGPSGLRMSRRPAALPPETASNNDPFTDLSDFCLQPDPAMTEVEARFFQEEQDAVSQISISSLTLNTLCVMHHAYVRAPSGHSVTNACIELHLTTCGELRRRPSRSRVDIKGAPKSAPSISCRWSSLRAGPLGSVLSGRCSGSCDFEPWLEKHSLRTDLVVIVECAMN